MRNLGPKSKQLLRSVGIESLADLQEVGSIEAYCRCREHSESVSLNLLWALEGALTNTDWKSVASTRREELLAALQVRRDFSNRA
jgi:DNA transformation protein